MSKWHDLGAALGRAFAMALPEAAKDAVRARYAATYGECRRCGAPLGGPSPEQICEGCHADEVLARAREDGEAPDA